MADFTIFRQDELSFEPRPGGGRSAASLSDGLREMRANIFRLDPGAQGKRHREGVQEELFVVLEGVVTLALGDPAELHPLAAGSAASVSPGTVIQVLNMSDAPASLIAIGAPPITGKAEVLPAE